MAEGQLRNVLRFVRSIVGGRPTRDVTDGSLLARFAAGHDEDAFAALVQRHGPMVQGVCRRVLGHVQDAEDAYQATFLVLARKAGSIHWHADVGNWLYQVAGRTAIKARAGRKWVRERPMIDLPEAERGEAPRDEVRPVVDEELGRLPEKYRAPVVLHYLEGKSYAETAQVLGWAEGTVSGRLSRARNLLRKRLARRGLALSATLVTTLLAEEAGAAALSASVIQATVRAARLFVAGQAVGDGVRAAALAEGVLKNMFISKLKTRALAVLALSLMGIGAGLLGWTLRPAEAAPEKPVEAKTNLLARRITADSPKIDDIVSILHIAKIYCEVELEASPGPKNLQVVLEFYKDGRKNDFHIASDVHHRVTIAERKRISLQAADLDYLLLAGGVKGHCRVQLDVGTDAGATGSSTDVSKDTFDFSKVVCRQAFPASAGSPTEAPLFYLVANSNNITGANTVQGVIDNNPKGDLLIAYLRVAE
jgi:RNA polymerase sigma factor (sigma-70 family)